MSYSFDRSKFSAPDFETSTFLNDYLKRAKGPSVSSNYDTLHGELKCYLDDLKDELYEVIHRDYGEFLRLSRQLAGADKITEEIKTNMSDMIGKIQVVRDHFTTKLEDIERHQLELKKDQLKEDLAYTKQEIQNIYHTIMVEEKDEDISVAFSQDGPRRLEMALERLHLLDYYLGKVEGLVEYDKLKLDVKNKRDKIEHELDRHTRKALSESNHEVWLKCLRLYGSLNAFDKAERVFRDVIVVTYLESLQLDEHFKSGGLSRDKELETFYENVLSFIETQKSIFIGEKEDRLEDENGLVLMKAFGFEIFQTILKKLSFIFMPVSADIFIKDYQATMEFLRKFENLLVRSNHSIEFRQSSLYLEFMKRWKFNVYFHLRFKETVVYFECLLRSFDIEKELIHDLKEESTENSRGLLRVSSSIKMMELIERIWSDRIYIESLSLKFWKLTLQIFLRYRQWIESLMASIMEPVMEKQSSNALSNTPAISLKRSLLLFHDIDLLVAHKIRQLFVNKILPRIPESKTDLDTFDESLFSLLEDYRLLLTSLSQNIVSMIVKDCEETLLIVQSIPSRYRMTNRDVPSSPSSFVHDILQPLSLCIQFCDGLINPEIQRDWRLRVCESITLSYAVHVREMLLTLKKTVDSLKRLKKASKKSQSIDSSAVSHLNLLTDEEKMTLQLNLDIEYFSKILHSFHIDSDTFKPYQDLRLLLSPLEK